MTLAQFVSENSGHWLSNPGYNRDLPQRSPYSASPSYCGECVSLVRQYCVQVLGFNVNGGNANMWPNSAAVLNYFNRLGQVAPQAGDVWVSMAGTYGHIGVVVNAGQMFDQNNPIGGAAKISKLWSPYVILRAKSGYDGGGLPDDPNAGDGQVDGNNGSYINLNSNHNTHASPCGARSANTPNETVANTMINLLGGQAGSDGTTAAALLKDKFTAHANCAAQQFTIKQNGMDWNAILSAAGITENTPAAQNFIKSLNGGADPTGFSAGQKVRVR